MDAAVGSSDISVNVTFDPSLSVIHVRACCDLFNWTPHVGISATETHIRSHFGTSSS